MSRGEQSGDATREAPATDAQGRADEAPSLAAFLHALARRVERDPVFAAHVGDALRESGLQQTRRGQLEATDTSRVRRRPAAAKRTNEGTIDEPTVTPDPFGLLRAHGEPGLRTALESLELTTLRGIVRAYHLDPARISARWTARDRVIGLIIAQVVARANHGKAFSRV